MLSFKLLIDLTDEEKKLRFICNTRYAVKPVNALKN